jgi:hypothetical protein
MLQSKQKQKCEGSLDTLKICCTKKGIQREGEGTWLLVREQRVEKQQQQRNRQTKIMSDPPHRSP